jgi:ribonuclease HI
VDITGKFLSLLKNYLRKESLMNEIFWVDPVDALVATTSDQQNNWFWVVVTAKTSFTQEGTVTSGCEPSRVDAYIAATQHITSKFAGVPVNLYTGDEAFAGSVRDLAAWPNIEVHDTRKLRSHRLNFSLVSELAELSGVTETLVIGCDGSFSLSQRTGGWAWVDERGNFGQGEGKSSSSAHSELEAVLLALTAHAGTNLNLVIRLDSKDALGLILNGSRENTPQAIRRVVTHIRGHALFAQTEFGWVHGHSGDPLNEAANRLAIAARRGSDAGVDPSLSVRTAQNIVSEHLEAIETGRLVPATAPVYAVA